MRKPAVIAVTASGSVVALLIGLIIGLLVAPSDERANLSSGDAQATVTETITETVEPTQAPEPADAAPQASDAPAQDSTADSADGGQANPTAPMGDYEPTSAPGVSLVDLGWTTQEALGGYHAHVGAVFYNNGPAIDMIDITVQGFDGSDVIDSSTESYGRVPADSFFALGTTLVDITSADDRLDVVIGEPTIGEQETLPLTATATAPTPSGQYENVSLAVSNSGSRNLPEDAATHVVLLGSDGTIIGGGTGFFDGPIPPGETRGVLHDVYTPTNTAAALAYIDQSGLWFS
ncbi:hypothetical protein RDV89_00810 [Nocardioides zeae]|uniref:DUF4352 domain-containing protein n=1 Tax=Nocardioides imazamoxiresistens TaxID=3231893 RepID=A0ABU3PQS5_9ACTN|nr:hypothetical protein [Nocardioides zeae]MDT9591586.1 hypothetical protein [Nocardioides zeae]